jgi:hypothetical protein
MNIIKAKSDEKGWNIDLGGLARIWKVSRQHWASKHYENDKLLCYLLNWLLRSLSEHHNGGFGQPGLLPGGLPDVLSLA